MNPELVATYGRKGARVDLFRGDGLELPADLAIFGRCPPLRDRLERLAGAPFRPASQPTPHGRRFDRLTLKAHPWRLVVSLDYRPRRVGLDARQTYPNLTHIDKLSDDLFWIVLLPNEKFEPHKAGSKPLTALFLPLSARNPEVVAVSTVLAIWCYLSNRVGGPFGWRLWNFRIVDLRDVTPYIRAFEDEDHCVTRALRAGALPFMSDGLLEAWSRDGFSRR